MGRDTVVYLQDVIVQGYEELGPYTGYADLNEGNLLTISYPDLLTNENFFEDGTRLIGVIRKY